MRRGWPFVLFALWAAGIAIGLGSMLHYETAAGEPGQPPHRWPSTVSISRTTRPALLMAVHPRCPCTRASLAELARILAATASRDRAVHLLILQPADSDPAWSSEAAKIAAALPQATATHDQGGRLANTFGMATSGHTLLYDADGVLVYSGGITPGRGREGANAGRQEIVDLIRGGAGPRQPAPVFGCSLRGPRRSTDD